jgi:hypothetical protein
LAVADAAGNVVLSGGSTRASTGNSYTAHSAMTFFDGRTLEMNPIRLSSDDESWIHHAGARFGDRGVLLCGGFGFPDGSAGDFVTHDHCAIISTAGAYTSQAESGITLPRPLLHHSMVGLADGSVLVTGGATYADGTFAVTNEAWIIDATGLIWTSVGPMHLNRAQHKTTLLPDGRVLVIGGVTAMTEHWWDGTAAVPCAEVFNPELGDFTELSPCTADAPDGDLPGAVSQPAVATDQARGISVVVGGFSRANDGATGAAAFIAPRQ